MKPACPQLPSSQPFRLVFQPYGHQIGIAITQNTVITPAASIIRPRLENCLENGLDPFCLTPLTPVSSVIATHQTPAS